MSVCSTKQTLFSLLEDIEIIAKQLFEITCAPKNQRPDDIDASQLLQLLIQRDKELQATLKKAQEQGAQQRLLDALKAEVEQRDSDIRNLQRSLKEAETVLSGAIYQAKQKLDSINQAKKRKISSEELIKYAHKISAHNTVAAPVNWQPGDTRRPYPTEMDIRLGFLGRADLPISSQAIPAPGAMAPGMGMERGAEPQLGAHHSLQWAPSMDMGPMTTPHPMDTKTHNKENVEDVEILSSDSSSSSSSDE